MMRLQSKVAVYLVIWKHQRIGDYNVFPPSSGEDYNLSYVIWREGFATTAYDQYSTNVMSNANSLPVDFVSFGFVAAKAYD